MNTPWQGGSTPSGSTNGIEEFLKSVQRQIQGHQDYFSRNMRRYRVARLVVIVAAGLVPVLATAPGIGKVWLGALGALAALTESVIQLYRWRDSGLAAMRAANELHVEVDLFRTGAPPYDDDDIDMAFTKFVSRTVSIRKATNNAFAGLWAEDQPPSAAAESPSEPSSGTATERAAG